MNSASMYETLALATATGMRSMAGPAALAVQQGGTLGRVLPLMAAGEMLVDKTSFVGDRIDPLPLTGRALMGAIVGAVVARRHGQPRVPAALVGAGIAIAAAHLAYHARKRAPGPAMLAGAAEDAIVVGLCAVRARGQASPAMPR